MTKRKLWATLSTACIAVLFLLPSQVRAQKDSLRLKIERIIQQAKGEVGVAIMGLEDRDTLTVNGKQRYPMQSVYKFHLAMAVLNQVDQGKLSLTQRVRITKKDLLPNSWSPLREKYPNGNVNITLGELLKYTVSHSDNNGCDILFRLLGGTQKVEAYIHGLGVKGVTIAATEEQMHQVENVQFTNWSEPLAMMQLLDIFYRRKNLSAASSNFLWKIMVETSTGAKRIKGLLPAGTIVAHKTGTSGTNAKGVTAATNDVGIVTLPTGKQVAVAVFVANSTANEETRERVIAEIAQAAWHYFSAAP